MACLAMHLAIGKKYLENHLYEDENEFIEGTLAPDLVDDKIKSHFGENKKPTTVKEMMEYKMDIVKAANAINLDSSFSRAEFLHLITDEVFYRFVYSTELEKWSPMEVKQAMYDDFDFVTFYILNKYNIELPDNLKHLAINSKGESKFFSENAIDKFIEVVASLDLEEARKQILEDLSQFRIDVISKLK